MKTTALAIALLFTTPALAGVADDYAACLIGEAAVALQSQTGAKKDPNKAQDVAYAKCKEPKAFPDDFVIDGLEDFVNMSVVAIAEGAF